MESAGHSRLLKFLRADTKMSQQYKIEYINPTNIESDVPERQEFREPDLNVDLPSDNDKKQENEDERFTFVPVMTVTKEEAVFTKGDLKLQKISVTEDVSEKQNLGPYVTINPFYYAVNGDTIPGPHQLRVVAPDSPEPAQDSHETEPLKDKPPQTRIPKLRLRQAVEKIRKEKKSTLKDSEKASLPSPSPIRRSSIPKLKKNYPKSPVKEVDDSDATPDNQHVENKIALNTDETLEPAAQDLDIESAIPTVQSPRVNLDVSQELISDVRANDSPAFKKDSRTETPPLVNADENIDDQLIQTEDKVNDLPTANADVLTDTITSSNISVEDNTMTSTNIDVNDLNAKNELEPEDLFDQIYEETTDNNENDIAIETLAEVLPEEIKNPEVLERKFEEVVHTNEDIEIQPFVIRPLVKQKSLHDIKTPKLLERRFSLKDIPYDDGIKPTEEENVEKLQKIIATDSRKDKIPKARDFESKIPLKKPIKVIKDDNKELLNYSQPQKIKITQTIKHEIVTNEENSYPKEDVDKVTQVILIPKQNESEVNKNETPKFKDHETKIPLKKPVTSKTNKSFVMDKEENKKTEIKEDKDRNIRPISNVIESDNETVAQSSEPIKVNQEANDNQVTTIITSNENMIKEKVEEEIKAHYGTDDNKSKTNFIESNQLQVMENFTNDNIATTSPDNSNIKNMPESIDDNNLSLNSRDDKILDQDTDSVQAHLEEDIKTTINKKASDIDRSDDLDIGIEKPHEDAITIQYELDNNLPDSNENHTLLPKTDEYIDDSDGKQNILINVKENISQSVAVKNENDAEIRIVDIDVKKSNENNFESVNIDETDSNQNIPVDVKENLPQSAVTANENDTEIRIVDNDVKISNEYNLETVNNNISVDVQENLPQILAVTNKNDTEIKIVDIDVKTNNENNIKTINVDETGSNPNSPVDINENLPQSVVVTKENDTGIRIIDDDTKTRNDHKSHVENNTMPKKASILEKIAKFGVVKNFSKNKTAEEKKTSKISTLQVTSKKATSPEPKSPTREIPVLKKSVRPKNEESKKKTLEKVRVLETKENEDKSMPKFEDTSDILNLKNITETTEEKSNDQVQEPSYAPEVTNTDENINQKRDETMPTKTNDKHDKLNEVPKKEIREIPIKKSVFSKIAMFERQTSKDPKLSTPQEVKPSKAFISLVREKHKPSTVERNLNKHDSKVSTETNSKLAPKDIEGRIEKKYSDYERNSTTATKADFDKPFEPKEAPNLISSREKTNINESGHNNLKKTENVINSREKINVNETKINKPRETPHVINSRDKINVTETLRKDSESALENEVRKPELKNEDAAIKNRAFTKDLQPEERSVSNKTKEEYKERSKSIVEESLGDVIVGKVQKMIVRINSIENLNVEKKEVINVRERPKPRAVSERIALFEGKSTPVRMETATRMERSTTIPPPTPTTALFPNATTPRVLTEEDYMRIIADLNKAKEMYGKIDNMTYLTLRDGKKMPVLILGTALLDERLLPHVIAAAIDLGYRGIDTAYIYGNERAVGDAIRAKILDGTVTREDLFIISKLWSTFHRQDLVETACRASLDAMGLDYFDLYLIHNPMSFKEGGEVIPKIANVIQYSEHDYLDAWYGMEGLVLKGMAKTIGVSNFNASQLAKVMEKARVKPAVNQVECHPYLNQQRLDQACEDQQIVLSCFGVLGSKGTSPAFKDSNEAVIDDPLVRVLAAGMKISPAQLLIRYQIECGHSAVVKASSAAHLWDNLQALRRSLTATEVEALHALNRNKRTYTFRGLGDTHKNYPFKALF